MIAAGVLGEDRRVELISGFIVDLMPAGSPHSSTVARLFKFCLRAVGDRYDMQAESRIALGDSAPEPDLWIASAPPDSFRQRQPEAGELLLVVEVADSSLEIDREVKLPLYAAAGIPEYWIVNLRDASLERYTEPRPDGAYAAKATLGAGQSLTHELLGEVAVGDLV